MGIFGKSETKAVQGVPRQAPAPAPAAAPAAATPAPGPVPAAASVIGPRAVVKGELLGDDDVLVQGRVEGRVRISRELRIAPGGHVAADVHAASIVVSGELAGNCVATHRIEIQATGRLTGDIRAPRVTIAEGASFRGKTDMGRGEKPAPTSTPTPTSPPAPAPAG